MSTYKPSTGRKNDVIRNRDTGALYPSPVAAAKALGISKSQVIWMLRRKSGLLVRIDYTSVSAEDLYSIGAPVCKDLETGRLYRDFSDAARCIGYTRQAISRSPRWIYVKKDETDE